MTAVVKARRPGRRSSSDYSVRRGSLNGRDGGRRAARPRSHVRPSRQGRHASRCRVIASDGRQRDGLRGASPRGGSRATRRAADLTARLPDARTTSSFAAATSSSRIPDGDDDLDQDDGLEYRYTWFVNGQRAGPASASSTPSRLRSADDEFWVEVVADRWRGRQLAAARAARREMANSPPDDQARCPQMQTDGRKRSATSSRPRMPTATGTCASSLAKAPSGMAMQMDALSGRSRRGRPDAGPGGCDTPSRSSSRTVRGRWHPVRVLRERDGHAGRCTAGRLRPSSASAGS